VYQLKKMKGRKKGKVTEASAKQKKKNKSDLNEAEGS